MNAISGDGLKLPAGLDDGAASARMRHLLMSSSPSRKEALWNWKAASLAINQSMAARQGASGKDLLLDSNPFNP